MKYWLMKTEPDVFSIDTLKQKGESLWDGVRNYQARNFMTNDMKPGDQVLFYHSSCEVPGIAGVAEVSGSAVPDPTQFDKKSEYFDEKAKKDKPTWFCVKVKFQKRFKDVVPLDQLRKDKKLKDMLLLRRGQRLSIQPVTQEEYQWILNLAE